MLYLFTPNSGSLLEHTSCGQLVTQQGFLHPTRALDTFVLITCIEGTLSIFQENNRYQVAPGQYLILFPGLKHGGIEESPSPLSYYWCHFRVKDDNFKLLHEHELEKRIANSTPDELLEKFYVLPEFGSAKSNERFSLFFRQLLDNSQEEPPSHHYSNYALSMLGIEITREVLSNCGANWGSVSHTQRAVSSIKEWIRINYANDISVKKVAWQFNYNPNYLSTIFKKYTGMPLLTYIHKTQLHAAKKMLLDSTLPVKTISASAGFKDEKNFMKTFKFYESMTPTQYRNTFYRTHLNNV